MPELPEVETVRRQLAPRLAGRTVLAAGSHSSDKFTPARELAGTRFVRVGRRAKFLIVSTDDDRELVIHLGMTGALGFRTGHRPSLGQPIGVPEADPDDKHLRAFWHLNAPTSNRGQPDPATNPEPATEATAQNQTAQNQTAQNQTAQEETLTFVDTRRFGRLRVVPAGDYRGLPTLHAAGPEPWDPELTPELFHELLSQSRRPIKTRLLSQRPVAGVGNIYADEALWMASINPKVTRLGVDRSASLLDAVKSVLEQGISNGGTTLRDYRNAEGGTGDNQHQLMAYGRGGLDCLRCGDTLRKAVIDARSTVWCPTCQRR